MNENRGFAVPIGPSFRDEVYPDKLRRGKAIIFNQLNFKGDDKNEYRRDGSEEDVKRLRKELTPLGFEVIVKQDLTSEQIKDTLKKIAEEDHSDADCLLVVVMSHGGQLRPQQDKMSDNYKDYKMPDEKFSLQLIEAYDKAYDEKELFEQFEGDKCISLRTKPKIFLIQACRGDGTEKYDQVPPIHFQASSQRDGENIKSSLVMCTMPKSADFLIFRATVDGTAAMRGFYGTPFIQTLCEELNGNRTTRGQILDLESLLVNVKRKCIEGQNTRPLVEKLTVEEVMRRSQMPCVYSTLIRKIYWEPKEVIKYKGNGI